MNGILRCLSATFTGCVAGPGRAAARLLYIGHDHGVLLGRADHGASIRYEGAAFRTRRH
jgi:hypothetical protein